MLAAAPAWADDAPAPAPDFTITGGANVSTQYRFRGISQSDNRPVFQGTFTITHKSGFYISTWGSSATGNSAVDIGGTEIDVYGGYSHSFAGFTLDGGVYGYLYPGSTHAFSNYEVAGLKIPSQNYFEVYADASKTFGPVTTKAGINWAPKQGIFKSSGFDSALPTHYNVYVYGELGLSLPNFPVAFHSHVGHTAGGFDVFTGAKPKQYIDYTVGATYKWKSLSFDLSYVGTNLSKHDVGFFDDGEDTVTKDMHRATKGALVGTIGVSF
jgi:uncharacterized protein (TIGR02001 family)